MSVEQSGEMQYRVVAPLLAGSGDYSPAYALINTNKVVKKIKKITYIIIKGNLYIAFTHYFATLSPLVHN